MALIPIPVAIAALGTISGILSGNKAGRAASRLSDAQVRALKQVMAWKDKYGLPALELAFQRLQAPYDTAYERGQLEQGRGDIERGYQPIAYKALQNLGQRNMLYSSLAPSATASVDRARGDAVADWYMKFRADKVNEQGRRLGQLTDILNSLSGSAISTANAFQNPINTYSNLAQQGAAGAGGSLGALAQWFELLKANKAPLVTTGPATQSSTTQDWVESQIPYQSTISYK